MRTIMISPSGRSAGILLPAFSPRRPGDLGIGDTRALREWIDWAARHRVRFLQLLPIQETGADDSPYNAISSVALEPAYLSFESEDLPWTTPEDVAEARAGMGEAATASLVDYRAVRKAKRGLLEKAWVRFKAQEDRAEFREFTAAESAWLVPYSRFRWLMEQNGGTETWDLWPAGFNDPLHALATMADADQQSLDERLSFFSWVQWLCFKQWRAVSAYADSLGVRLMGDIPIGVSWYSADVFFGQSEFNLEWCGGAPPERVFKHDAFIRKWGQNWGIPLYRWDKMEAEGYPWWRQRVAKLAEIFHLFRIDHILGFYRIYAFPWRPQLNGEFLHLSKDEALLKTGGRLPGWAWRPDDTPENQAANRDDGDRRLRMVMEAAGASEVVGEDLGCVPEYVRPHLASLGIAGFRIPHWDFDEEGHVIPKEQLPECSFATYATHDHDTLAGMWDSFRQDVSTPGTDEDDVAKSAGYLRLLCEFADISVPKEGWPAYSDAIQWRLIKSLFASKSRYAAIMITDLTAMRDRFNRPGTVGGENWRLRLPWSPSGLLADPKLEAASAKLAQLIELSGR